MLLYMACVAVTIMSTNVAQSHSTESFYESFTSGIDSLAISQSIQRGSNSEEMNYGPKREARGFASLFNEEERKCQRECRNFQYELFRRGLLNQSDTARISKSQCFMPLDIRISGGYDIENEEFPHMVSLGWFEKQFKFIHRCGGSLISEKWILTAAHCAANFQKNRGVARLGMTRLSDISSGTIIEIVEIVRHPEYKEPTLYADIALMRLARTVEFSNEIQPACFHAQFGRVPKMAWATGWGSSDFDDELVQDRLHAERLEIIDTLVCAREYKKTIEIPRGIGLGMLCAGDPQGGWKKDTCRGDSGGPLQIFNIEYCLHVIVGVTSFGKLCGTPHFPGVYTRVSYYLDWIESIVWEEEEALYPSS